MKIIHKLKELFFSGLFTLIPIFCSLSIIRFIINLFSKWFYPIHKLIPLQLHVIPYSEIVIVCILITIIGFIIQKFLLDKMISFFEKHIVQKIPIFNTLYFGIKQVLKIINHKDKKDDNQLVAWVRLPYKNIYCLGLMTGSLPEEISPDKTKAYLCFFVPHTPNPITGYYITAAEEDCVFTTMTRQEAISMIISGGIIKPER